ncbi:hypothetical protein LARI1_G003538 [Lachnellula arida]|uniref:BZIP domain-containing protein n=1 Tax=Lachnellula arida TaxID=1316785 RepID=A0A8T9BLW3_9HELO|nr:hypothetical protein LARI1_G003538 [Lachnellula arida]
MARKASTESDLWFGVLDPRKRKQIQNRLAQRARRQRLAKQTADTQPTPRSSKTHPTNASTPSKPIRSINSNGTRDVDLGASQLLSIIRDSRAPVSSDHRLLPLPHHTLFSALFRNGVILGLSCSTSSIGISTPTSTSTPSTIPESLRPTPLQVRRVHFQWIDRFPFPRMRDNMIERDDAYSAEDFLGDIFSVETFRIRPGFMSWDPEAWVVKGDFRKKWMLLLDDPELAVEP